MDAGRQSEVREVYLLEEVMRVNELARAIKSRIWDVFIKKEQPGVKKDEAAPPANPIDYAIEISQSTQQLLKGCLELLELEIITRLVGKH